VFLLVNGDCFRFLPAAKVLRVGESFLFDDKFFFRIIDGRLGFLRHEN